jgi:hypothetical protein
MVEQKEEKSFTCRKVISKREHYEKSCLHKLHYLSTRCSKQLMCTYVTTISWRYGVQNIKCDVGNSQIFIVIAC